jgi:hypothetical protein
MHQSSLTRLTDVTQLEKYRKFTNTVCDSTVATVDIFGLKVFHSSVFKSNFVQTIIIVGVIIIYIR